MNNMKALVVFTFCVIFVFNCETKLDKKSLKRHINKSASGSSEASPVLQIADGQIEGQKLLARSLLPLENYQTFWYYAFQGIPYSKPPVGPLRFKDPLPVKPWLGVRKCVTSTVQCVDDDGKGNEDCLYLNVYTPQLRTVLQRNSHYTQLLPVLFFIYGGAFSHGNASYGEYAPDFMIQTGIVIVTVNYRVGPFGFLTTADSAIPGNAGLKDQLMALKWVKRNIRAFSGDPNKVTLVGQSAGGACVHLHLMSHLSKGLFIRAVSESSTGISGWATQPAEQSRNLTYEIARQFNITTNNTMDLANQLRRIDAPSLAKAAYNHDLKQIFPSLSPVVEAEGSTNFPFLLNDPYDIAESCEFNNVPFIIGVNTGEGVLFGSLALVPKLIPAAYLYYLKEYVAAIFGLDEERTKDLEKDVTAFYFGDKSPSLLTFSSVIDVISDSLFTYNVLKTVAIQRKCQKIYVYQFSFLGKFTFGSDWLDGLMTNIYKLPPIQKVCHGDELGYYWYRVPINGVDNYPLTNFSSFDRKTHHRMMSMWSSFIKYGFVCKLALPKWPSVVTKMFLGKNPNAQKQSLGLEQEWPFSKHHEKGITYLNIEKNLTVIKNRIPFERNMLFWVKMQKKYGKKPNLFDELLEN